MPRYLLDTDTCSYIMKASNADVLRRLQLHSTEDVCISLITKCELMHGVEISPRQTQDRMRLEVFLRHIAVLDFPDGAAPHYALIRAELKQRGTITGSNDLFLAAHARSLGLTLVTNNTREFARVPGLKLENWA
jgi:tRNA(fMet)-specific endonuclease VapC